MQAEPADKITPVGIVLPANAILYTGFEPHHEASATGTSLLGTHTYTEATVHHLDTWKSGNVAKCFGDICCLILFDTIHFTGDEFLDAVMDSLVTGHV